MPFDVIDVQATPNPNATKYVLDRPIVETPQSFFNSAAAHGNSLASKLFTIQGVTSVLMLGDFVTINKRPDVKWSQITPAVKQALSEA